MTDRGAASDLSSVACPFVAFEDDRDGRGPVPDHRHRCYAEVRPAPRALAHQERYCLSAGFAACPTFVDWARREAARVRPGAASGASAAAGLAAGLGAGLGVGSADPVGQAAPVASSGPVALPPPVVPSPVVPPPAAAPPAGAPATDQDDVWPRRTHEREWAAPPPWGAAGAAAAAGAGADGPDVGTGPVDDAEAPPFLVGRDPTPQGSSTPVPPQAPQRPPPPVDDDLEPDAAMRRFGPAAGRTRHDDATSPPTPARRRTPVDPDAPAWEQPRRIEAYPTLRTRAGLPNMSPLLLGAAAVIIGAVILFFLPSFLLDLGGGSGSTSPTPSASAAASATPVPSVTPVPSPTPVTYVVKSGDTLSKIAASFGVSLDDLIAANKEALPDPDKLQVGDEIIIPAPPPDEFTAEPSPSPS